MAEYLSLRWVKYFFLFLFVTTILGCESIKLSGNFQEWPRNFQGGEIPGNPDGDRVILNSPQSGEIQAGAYSEGFVFQDNACERGADCFGSFKLVQFLTSNFTPSQQNDPIVYIFSGVRFALNNAKFLLTIGDGGVHAPILIKLYISEKHEKLVFEVESPSGALLEMPTVYDIGQQFDIMFELHPSSEVGKLTINDKQFRPFHLLNKPENSIKGLNLFFTEDIATGSRIFIRDFIILKGEL